MRKEERGRRESERLWKERGRWARGREGRQGIGMMRLLLLVAGADYCY